MIKVGRIFLVVFVLSLLIVPLFCINTSEITEQENRSLAKFPKFLKDERLNYEFGKEFESWLCDRFGGRDQLIGARFQTLYKINGRIENELAFIGDDGWMFDKVGIVNVPSIDSQRRKIQRDADILKRFDDKFRDRGIPIYFVLVPDRNQLYQKYWARYYTPKPRLDYGKELIRLLSDHPNIHIIYPKEEFLDEMKKENLFYKDDGHLTGAGGLVLLKTVEKYIQQDFLSSIHYDYKLKKKTYQGMKRIEARLHKVDKTDFDDLFEVNEFFIDGRKADVSRSLDQETVQHFINKDASVEKKLYFFGICYGERILNPFLQYVFKELFFFYSHDKKLDKAKENARKYLETIDSDSVIILLYTDGMIYRSVSALLE